MQTIVASSNDALGLLFQAIEQPNEVNYQDSYLPDPSSKFTEIGGDIPHELSQDRTPYSTTSTLPTLDSLSTVGPEILKLWGRCRFVKQGWLSAREAVTLVDL